MIKQRELVKKRCSNRHDQLMASIALHTFKQDADEVSLPFFMMTFYRFRNSLSDWRLAVWLISWYHIKLIVLLIDNFIDCLYLLYMISFGSCLIIIM